jgi:Fic family protein
LEKYSRSEAGDEPANEAVRQDVEEVVNYRHALEAAEEELTRRPFSLNLVRNIHKVLMTSVRGHNKAPGEFRRVQNYIGRPGAGIEEASFIPPSPELLLKALGEWEIYFHADERNVLVQLAIVHAQFEILHPFLDGNGRIGRILIPLFLHQKGLLKSPMFYLSEYLEEHRSEYISRLAALHHESDGWTQWCAFFLEAITVQSERNVKRVESILKLREGLTLRLRTLTNSSYSEVLLDAMFDRPIFNIQSMLHRDGMPGRPMMTRLLASLVAGDVLRLVVKGAGRKGNVYSLHQLVRLCEAAPSKRKKL